MTKYTIYNALKIKISFPKIVSRKVGCLDLRGHWVYYVICDNEYMTIYQFMLTQY